MTATDNDLAKLFLAFSRQKLFDQYWPRLKECVAPLSEEQMWWRPNDASNSIGNLLLHLNGNVGQWLVASFNKDEDTRNRPAEFAAKGDASAAELLAKLGATLNAAAAVLDRLTVMNCSRPTKFRATTCAVSTPSIRSWSTSACTTGKSRTSPRASPAAISASIRS